MTTRPPAIPDHLRRLLALDPWFAWMTWACAIGLLIVLVAVVVMLFAGGWQAFHTFGWGFLTSASWDPVQEQFGALVPVIGTLVSSLIAVVIAVPIAFGVALFVTELAPPWIANPVGNAVELLAAVPSIIYGMWGLFIFCPLFAGLEPWIDSHIGAIPWLGALFRGPPMGIGMLPASFILAIMILPFIAAVMRDVFRTTPTVLRESAYGLGATTWEVVRNVVIPHTRIAVVGGIFLGLARALGETMAVTFVIGNANNLSLSLLAPGNSISATIANEFAEAETDIYRSVLLALGFLLCVISLIVLSLARGMLAPAQVRAERQMQHPLARAPPAHRPPSPSAMAAASAAFGIFCAGVDPLATVWKGASALRPEPLHHEHPGPPGSPGGLRNAFVGSGIMVAWPRSSARPRHPGRDLAGRQRPASRSASVVRFMDDVLAGVPSIVVGLFAYALVVRADGPLLGLAGALALALHHVPVLARTTDEMLRLVPPACARRRSPLGAPAGRDHLAIVLARGARRHPHRRAARASRASAARPRRCCSPRSTTSSGASTRLRPMANI